MTYLTSEPFAAFDDYRRWVDQVSRADDPLFHAVMSQALALLLGGSLGLARAEPAAPQR